MVGDARDRHAARLEIGLGPPQLVGRVDRPEGDVEPARAVGGCVRRVGSDRDGREVVVVAEREARIGGTSMPGRDRETENLLLELLRAVTVANPQHDSFCPSWWTFMVGSTALCGRVPALGAPAHRSTRRRATG